MKKIFITGISGFAGSHLADLLVENSEFEIHGTYSSQKSLHNIAPIQEKIKLYHIDLRNFDEVLQLIQKIRPDVVYHLAAMTSPAESFLNATRTIVDNVTMQMNILNALHKEELPTRTLIISSAEVYGRIEPSDLPVDEDTPFRPVNPYAVSKLTQDYVGFQYFLSYKMDIVRIRPFNHIGPRQSPLFAVGAFASQIAEIEKGKKEPVIRVGNLEAKRDFTDVRDMVKAYMLLAEKGKSGEVYNVGSGTSHKMSEILEMLLTLSEKKIEIKTDPARLRPSDIEDIYCDAKKISSEIGWQPTVPLEKTLKDTLDYWREIV